MLVSVFEAPSIVFCVNVCVPVSVATVESIAIVTLEEPLYEVPESPVLIVSVPLDVAVTVIVPPSETVEPLIVIDEFVRLPFAIFESVFVEPLMVVPDKVESVPPSETEVEPIVIALFVSPALGIVATAVNALVPFPTKYPVSEFAPVPPLAGISVPLRVMAPDCAELGRRPVVPPLKVTTPPAVENCLQDPEEYPSKVCVSVLKRIWPCDPPGCCPVVPKGSVAEAVPGRTTLSLIEIVGLPLIPSPFATPIWLEVPTIWVLETVPPVLKVTRPFTLALANPST
jgi:hypothetical protein